MCEVTQRIRDDGRREGEKTAINKISAVLTKLLAAGKTEEMNKAIQDREYLKKLMDEYQK